MPSNFLRQWPGELCRQCQRCSRTGTFSTNSRALSQVSKSLPQEELEGPLDPRTVLGRVSELRLMREQHLTPIGSRRRRAAISQTKEIPFEQRPYHCFQEARKVLQEDRAEKLNAIEQTRAKIERVLAQPAKAGQENHQKVLITSLRKHLENLKIQADINDPMIKRRFEDGKERKWKAYDYLLSEQRISQFHIVPDVLDHVKQTAAVSLYFYGTRSPEKVIVPRLKPGGKRATVVPGMYVASKVSEQEPRLKVQVFNKGTRNIAIAIVDPDVPNIANDSFETRCHFLATNISISPSSSDVRFETLDGNTQVVLPWLPPYAQKGSPYHRLVILVLEQPEGVTLDVNELKKLYERNGFSMRSFAMRNRLCPVGASLFRTQWDSWMDDLMTRLGVGGIGEELKRRRVEPLPYKKRDVKRLR